MGSNSEHILLKITPVNIQNDATRFKKQMDIKKYIKKKEQIMKYTNYEFNRFWDERY